MPTNVNPAFPPARQDSRQVTNTIKLLLPFNDPRINGATTTQTFSLGASLPKGALITGVTLTVQTQFNNATSATLSIGQTGAGFTDILPSTNIKTQAVGITEQKTAVSGASIGPLTADAPLSAVYTPAGGAATAGQVAVVIEYEGGISPT